MWTFFTVALVGLLLLGGWVSWLMHREQMLRIRLDWPVDEDDE